MIRSDDILRPVHDPLCDPVRPLWPKSGGRDLQPPPRTDAYGSIDLARKECFEMGW